MDDAHAEELYLTMFSRGEMQRVFFGMLLRRLARDVPAFSLDLLSEQLHVFLQHAPQAQTETDPKQALMAEISNEELRKLIEMVEQAIVDAKDAPDI